MSHGSSGVDVGHALFDSLANIDRVRDVIPAGPRGELVNQSLGFRADIVDIGHSLKLSGIPKMCKRENGATYSSACAA